MQTARAWICRISICTLAILSCWEGFAHAQQNADAGFVNYQITPLPPITEVSLPNEIPAPAGSEADNASAEKPVAEEVKPLEVEGNSKAAEGEEGQQDEIKSELEVPIEEETWWYFWRPWAVSYELGINGSVGNSNTHTWRSAIRTKKATDTSVLTANADYKKSIEESNTTADRLYSEWRAEFPNTTNKWSWYLHGTVEFDAFRAYDARATEDSGIGYQWYKTDVGSFITRLGAGTSREFGGPDDEWVPEGAISAVFEHQLTKKQKLSFSSDFFYDLTNFNENRMNSQADWSVVLDEEANLSLKVSVINRYDSTPDGKKPNDLDYSTVLLWAF
jgi:putative salt-induced outer membrane protein YdiY